MGRFLREGDVVVPLRVNREVYDRLGALVGRRERVTFMRAAIEAAMRSVGVEDGVTDEQRDIWGRDDELFFSSIMDLGGVATERSVSRSLGWADLRISGAIERLVGSGRITVSDGVIEVKE